MARIEYIRPPDLYVGDVPLTPATRAGQLVCISGIPGFNADGKLECENFSAQMRQVMDNITRILVFIGAGWDRVVKVNVFLTRREDVQVMNEIYRQYFRNMRYPARTTVVVAALPQPDFLVEIECHAVLDCGSSVDPPTQQ